MKSIMGKCTIPLRFVEVAKAREYLREAAVLFKEFDPRKRKPKVQSWLFRLDAILAGLPQKFDAGDLVSYRLQDGARVDGIVIATVTCHEQYVVGPGEQRDKNPGPMFMIHAYQVVKRGEEVPELNGKSEDHE